MKSSVRFPDERSQAFRSEDIIFELQGSIKNMREMAPAVATGMQALETAHTTVNTYSPDTAENLPLSNQAGILRKVALVLLPVFLAFGWVSFFESVALLARVSRREEKEKRYDKNKRAKLWLDVVVNFIAAAGSTVAVAFLFAGLAYLAPYIITAVLAVNVIYGLVHTIAHLYFASRMQKPVDRHYHLKEAAKYLLGIVINTLAIVLNVFIFQTAKLLTKGIHDFASDILSVFLHFQEFMDLINGPIMAGVGVIKVVGVGWLASASLWLLISAAKLNQQSYQLIRKKPLADSNVYEDRARQDVKELYLIVSNRSGRESFGKRAFLLLASPILVPLYGLTGLIHLLVIRPAAALLLGIPQLLLLGISAGVTFCYSCVSRRSNQVYPQLPGTGGENASNEDLLPSQVDDESAHLPETSASQLLLSPRQGGDDEYSVVRMSMFETSRIGGENLQEENAYSEESQSTMIFVSSMS